MCLSAEPASRLRHYQQKSPKQHGANDAALTQQHAKEGAPCCSHHVTIVLEKGQYAGQEYFLTCALHR